MGDHHRDLHLVRRQLERLPPLAVLDLGTARSLIYLAVMGLAGCAIVLTAVVMDYFDRPRDPAERHWSDWRPTSKPRT